MKTKIRADDGIATVHIEEESIINDEKRLTIIAYSKFDSSAAMIDLLDVIDWVRQNNPKLLKVN